MIANVGWGLFLWEFVARPWVFGVAMIAGFVVEWYVVRVSFDSTASKSLVATAIANATSLTIGSLGFGLTPILLVPMSPIMYLMSRNGSNELFVGISFYVAWSVLLAVLSLAVEYPLLRWQLKRKLSWRKLGILLMANFLGSAIVMISIFWEK